MIKKVLIILGSRLLELQAFRIALEYLLDWSNGFAYESYSLKDEADLAISFLKNSSIDGGVVVDAGANIGAYTESLLMSECVFRKIIMIEPAPFLHGGLKDIASRHSSAVLEPIALGSEPGSHDLFFDKEGSGLASLYRRNISHVGIEMSRSTRVPVETLDSIVSRHPIGTIDYLKLDLEGHELEALMGAEGLLQAGRIRAITFEFGGCNIDSGTYLKSFWLLLVEKYGFTFYRLIPGRRLMRLERYSESLERFNWQNILACAPGVSPPWKVIR